MSGYIKLYRSSRGTSIAQHPEYFAAWVHLLLMATHKERQQVVGTKVVTLKPGQLVFGRLKFSANTGISENKVRSALTVMKELGMITSKSHSKFSVITITKWLDYQGGSPADNQQATSKPPASNHKQECIKNGKNEQEDTPLPPKGGTDDYSPEFEQAWKDKPKREGGNSKKAAYKAWRARIREGATVEELANGMERYRKFCEAKKIISTDKVKMMATFWGPDEHYLEDYATSQSNGYDPMSRSTQDDEKNMEFQRELIRMTRQ